MGKGDPSKVSKFVRVFADQVQVLETNTNEVKMLRQFAYAENAELDGIGKIVGENRQGKTDADYRVAILVRINTNASKGEPERIVTALRQITQSTNIHYVEYYPGVIYLSFSFIGTITGLLEYLQNVCPGGVRLLLEQYSTTHPFRFDIGPDGFDSGYLGILL
jgi:hypothetical protein